MWRNEPSHSQKSFHFGSWNPSELPNVQRAIARVKIQWLEKFFYIIKKLLKHRCLKWARITHLDIWNRSYGQKKGRKSNWQFDSWPLKVKNHPNFLVSNWRATYCWKALNEGYNFVFDFVSIGGLNTKLWGPKVTLVPTLVILGLPFGSPGTKCYLDVGLM